MQRIAERDGENPLFEMERGEITEADFLDAAAGGARAVLGHRPEMHRFREIYFEALEPEPADDRPDARAEGPRATGWRC